MPDVNWDEIIAKAKQDTDNKFKNKMSSLTTLTDNDIEKLLSETGIEKEDFASVLKEINNAATSNKAKVAAISKISKGLELLVGIAKKFI
jgi:hypothetical protein